MNDPDRVMKEVFKWLNLKNHSVDFENLTVRPHESDSYYRFKYQHKTYKRITPPQSHMLPQRIKSDIEKQFEWFNRLFYRNNY
jgi:sulfotransferase